MFVKIFFKEWRENIIIFSIAILLMLALVALSLSNQRELTLYFSGMFLLLFLPFSALLIGSGGFYSEFKDNAWIYLFSRPIKKWQIWVFKCVSLLSILFVIFLIFFLVKQALPGLDEILKDINFPTEIRGLFSFSLYFVLPLLAFTISFSISILTEKQFVIFFGSIVIGTGLAFLFQRYLFFLWRIYYYYGSFKSFAVLIGLSFILASIFTFIKADFSQTKKKILTFSAFLAFFLIVSFALGTAWVAKGDLFTGSREFYPSDSHKHQGNLYLASMSRGIFKYDSKTDKVKRLGGKFMLTFDPVSIGGDKIAFFKYSGGDRKRGLYEDLWMVTTDGAQSRALTESRQQGSPFFHQEFRGNGLLSPDGGKIIFATGPRAVRSRKTSTTIWRMNIDGTELKSQILEFPPHKRLRLIAWPPSGESLILMIEEMRPNFKSQPKILEVNLEKGAWEVLFEDFISEFASPGQDWLAIHFRDRQQNDEILEVLNLKTFEKEEIFKADSLKLWAVKWNRKGDKIAISKDNEFWVYSLAGSRAQLIGRRNYSYEAGIDWLADDKRLVLMAPLYGEYYLKVLKEDFSEEKSIKIPYRIERPVFIWGLDNRVLAKFRNSPLFGLDLETEKWNKIY